jgi:hypothetical protein
MIELRTDLNITPALVKFQRLAGRFTNFRPVLGGRVDVLARRLIRQQFQTQGRASGRGQWPALQPTYLLRRVLPDKPILRQSDGLFEALTKKGHPDQEVVLEPNRYSLTIAEGADTRARFIGHQLGIPESNVPVRQMIPDPLPKTFIDEVRRAVKSYVVEGRT